MGRRQRADLRPGRHAAVLLVVAVAVTARAEMSDDDYRGSRAAVPADLRGRVEAEVQAARASEVAAEERRTAALEVRARELAAQRARQPMGEQLLRARCSACHASALVEGVRYGAIGWRWTVERMRWWHGAPVTAGEAASIARHLAHVQPAAASQDWKERAILGGIAVTLWSVAGALRRRWGRRRLRPGG